MDQYNEVPTEEELESLFINNDNLIKLEAHFNEFNPIKIMRMEKMEIRHSAILAWLLDPLETHGFDDEFLKAFLCEALRGQSTNSSPTAMDVARSDMRDSEIKREWKNIDISIQSDRNNWMFIIENKFFSKQHKGQLSKYSERVNKYFENDKLKPKVRGVFLTLLDEEPEDTDFSLLSYHAIIEILDGLIIQKAGSMSMEVKIFLRHYLDILKEETGMSKKQNEMEAMAKQLYREHRKVLDFITEHGSNSDFQSAADVVFGEGLVRWQSIEVNERTYIYDWSNHRKFSLLPIDWYTKLGSNQAEWKGCNGWWTGAPLAIWFQLYKNDDGTKGKLWLYAEVGSLSDAPFRKGLVQTIKKVSSEIDLKNIHFQKGAESEGSKYSKFLKNNSETIKDINNSEEIAEKMKSLLTKFEKEFDSISKVLPTYAEYLEHINRMGN